MSTALNPASGKERHGFGAGGVGQTCMCTGMSIEGAKQFALRGFNVAQRRHLEEELVVERAVLLVVSEFLGHEGCSHHSKLGADSFIVGAPSHGFQHVGLKRRHEQRKPVGHGRKLGKTRRPRRCLGGRQRAAYLSMGEMRCCGARARPMHPSSIDTLAVALKPRPGETAEHGLVGLKPQPAAGRIRPELMP